MKHPESYFGPDILAETPALGSARVQSGETGGRTFFHQPDLPAGAPTLKNVGEIRTREVGTQRFSFQTPDLSPLRAQQVETQSGIIPENGKIGFGQLPERKPSPLYPTLKSK